MFNFNLNWDAIADFNTNFDPVAFEKELAAIVNVMTVTAVNSPAVVDAPKNTTPSSAAVQTVVNQVAQAVAPIVAPSVPPRIITKLEDISVGAVLDNPQVKSSPSGSTVSPTVVDKITSSIASTFKNDAQKDAELRAAIQENIPVSRTDSAADAAERARARQSAEYAQSVNQPAPAASPASVRAADERVPAPTPIPTPTPTPTKTPAYTPDAQDIRDPKTGLTPAQVEAQKAIEEAQRVASAAGIKTELVTPAGKAGTIKILSEETKQQNFTGRGISNDPLMADGKAFTGNRNGIEYKNGVAVDATRADILQADREARMKAEAEARAKSNPAYDFKNRPTAPESDENYVYYYSWIGGVNTGEWTLYKAPNTPENRAKYGGRAVGGATNATGAADANNANTLQNQPKVGPDGTIQNPGPGNTVPGPGTGGTGGTGIGGTGGTGIGGTSTGGTGLDSTTLTLIQSLQSQIASLTANTQQTATTKAAEKLAERQSAFDVLRAEMDALGLAALVEPLRGLIQKDVSPSEFAIELRQSEAYKNRFIANEGRLKKGLRVLTPGEYLRVEDAYRQTLRTYGLKQFDNDQYVSQFIENDISAAELSDRVATAVQRVQNADPAISRTLRDYYGIGQTDLVAYVLDPNQQLQKIQRQVAAAEIGTAARKQGLEAGVTVSEQLAAQGITEAEAQKGYATIADILPTSEKLSQIYRTTLEGYGQVEAEQEVFNQLASAQRKRQRLVSRELAEFSGQTGVGRGSLGTATGGQY